MSQQVRRLNEKRKWPNRIGRLLPNDQKYVKQWLNDLIKEVEEKYSEGTKTTVKLDKDFVLPDDWIDPLIQKFKAYVDKDPTLHMQYTQMFTEVTESQTPTETPQVQSYQVMFLLVNFIMKGWAPRYSDHGLVGFPINIILNRAISGNCQWTRRLFAQGSEQVLDEGA